MSLDVYLILEGSNVKGKEEIWIREEGQQVCISREEWDRRYPDREPVVFMGEDSDEVFHANITHNLGKMADATGTMLYEALWRPEELPNQITYAKDLISYLSKGLAELLDNPDKYKQLNPENGWGSYEGLVKFVEDYLVACIKYPEAEITVSR